MLRKRKKDAYSDWLKTEFGGMVESLELPPMEKRFLISRWLDQVAWMEGEANEARDRYYFLRLVTVVGAVILPALVGLNTLEGDLGDAVRVATWIVSLLVAVSAAVEEFFHFGERWHHYRQTVERLKKEGWLYFQLSGPYGAGGGSHASAYPGFAQRVEEIIQSEVDVYVTQVTVEKQERAQGEG